MKTGDFEAYSWRVSRPYLQKGSWEHNDTHRTSLYRHPAGVVEVDEYLHGQPIVAMRLVHKGICHCRRWEAMWGDKTLARLAREFIEEITR